MASETAARMQVSQLRSSEAVPKSSAPEVEMVHRRGPDRSEPSDTVRPESLLHGVSRLPSVSPEARVMFDELNRERHQLVEQELSDALDRRGRLRLKLVEWALDRLDEEYFGGRETRALYKGMIEAQHTLAREVRELVQLAERQKAQKGKR